METWDLAILVVTCWQATGRGMDWESEELGLCEQQRDLPELSLLLMVIRWLIQAMASSPVMAAAGARPLLSADPQSKHLAGSNLWSVPSALELGPIWFHFKDDALKEMEPFQAFRSRLRPGISAPACLWEVCARDPHGHPLP